MSLLKMLFLAIAIPEDVAQDICGFYQDFGVVRWVKPENMHITLRFLGELNDEVVSQLQEELKLIKLKPCEMKLGDLRFWEPNILNIAVEGNDGLSQLKLAIDKVVDRYLSLPIEHKNFHPHITIARIKKPIDHVLLQEVIQSYNAKDHKLSFNAHAYYLYESKADKYGNSVYEKIYGY